MAYKEIGELAIGRELRTGIMPHRNNDLAKKSLLYPDGERLLYTYTIDPHVKDVVHYNDAGINRLVFIGKDVFIDYNINTGNFYSENPRYILRSLCKAVEEGGLGLSQEDLFAVSRNLQYALLVYDWVYITSQKVNGQNVLFRYNILTREIENVAYDDFTNNIGDTVLLCKMIDYAGEVYFFVYKENTIKVYIYNTAIHSLILHENLTNLANHNTPPQMTDTMFAALADKASHKLFMITAANTDSYKIYNFDTEESKTITSSSLTLLGSQILHSGINNSTIPNEGLFIVTDNSIVYFLSKGDSSFTTTRVILNGTYGITNVVRYKNSSGAIQYLIFYTKADGTQNFITVDALSLYGTDITIDVSSIQESEPLMRVFSEKTNIAGFYFHDEEILDIIYGSYEEAGINRILIKQLSPALFGGIEHPFIIQENIEKSSAIINVEGSAYGDMQLSRLHLRAEDIEKDTAAIPSDVDVFLHENETDDTKFTTGSYLWKQLYKTELPFNTHIETAGRIIIDGYDIPISKTYITRAKEPNEYGDVLLTFDKYFNAAVIEGALHENITQYPGALFFKNKGFLADAIISNSYEMEGSHTYNDGAGGDLFNVGLHAITASKILDDGTLLVAGNYECLASVNINTFGYTNIKGESKGDEPPPYYRAPTIVSDGHEPDNIKAIIPWKQKIFILTNSGRILRTPRGMNSWQEITNPDVSLTGNLVHYLNNRNCKAYEILDNLLISSWPFGSISSFDLEYEVYSPVTHGNVFPSTPYPDHDPISSQTIAGNSLTIGNKIYFVGGISESSGSTLCWFDSNAKTFGFAKGSCNLFTERTKNRVDLTTDGSYIYLLFSKDDSSTLVQYHIEDDTFTVLSNTPFKHSRCGIYYYNKCIYALF
jgi:hypothetical protein